MRVHQHRLCIRITNDTNTGITFKLSQFVLELRTEIRVLQIVNRTEETMLCTIRGHTAATGAQM